MMGRGDALKGIGNLAITTNKEEKNTGGDKNAKIPESNQPGERLGWERL